MHRRLNAASLSPLRLSAVLAALASSALSAGCVGGIGGDGEIFESDSDALTAIYQVGPTRAYKDLGQLAGKLRPGDVVQIDGNATYPAAKLTMSGTALAKITIRGLRVNGKRPVFAGGYNSIEVNADHYVLEGLDVTGGSARCFYHHGDDITLRDSVVHDCPMQGILGGDYDTGSLTLDYVEVHHCGNGTQNHSIYMATDETAHPGSVFRMQHCYVHDTNGGNAVKSRAERNEIYYNWIEGAYYKELELIGPDGQDPSLAREDSDVVGNVFRKTHTQYVVRVGGDGTGDTNGRYRFVSNTFLLAPGSAQAFQFYDGIESIEMHNNVFYRQGGGALAMVDDMARWSTGAPILVGTNNFVPTGSTFPSQWRATVQGANPGFVDLANRKLTPVATSPLVNAGNQTPMSPVGHAIPRPLPAALELPPPGAIQTVGAVLSRLLDGRVDIGAYEYGTTSGGTTSGGTTSGGTTSGGTTSGGTTSGGTTSGGVCSVASVNEWKNGPVTTETGSFTATFDATPSMINIDSGFGLSLGAQSRWQGLAAIVHFSPTGIILVRQGSGYASDASIQYKAGTTYHVRMVVNVERKVYSVYVRPGNDAEIKIASDYAFRTEQAAVSTLDHWAMWDLTAGASLQVCNVALQ